MIPLPGLLNPFKDGGIRFETQLLDFPRSADKDMIDAFSYISQFLQGGEMYMRNNTADTRYTDWDDMLKMSVRREDEALARLMRQDRSMKYG